MTLRSTPLGRGSEVPVSTANRSRYRSLGWGITGTLLALCLASALVDGCLVQERCFSSVDCRAGEVCLPDGRCGFECTTDADCGAGLRCETNRCVGASAGPIECPEDMVSVADAFCVDRYEASHRDATEGLPGTDESVAVSRPGVIPWQVRDNASAAAACKAAGKGLCTAQQWQLACRGHGGTVYGYGDQYEPATCNGIDLFGMESIRLLPTGSLPACKSDWGVYDINGNLWEHVAGGNDSTIRGGAYNCIDSKTLHRCDYIPGDWTPSARGFRCCWLPGAADAGADDADSQDADAALSWDTGREAETGCIEEDSAAPADVSIDTSSPSDAEAHDVEPEPGDVADLEGGDEPVASPCPPEMVRVDSFCMDRYEASHADATAVSIGTSPVAASLPGVLPWFSVTLPEARAACVAAGKRLCRLDEWVQGCSGSAGTVYAYGNTYDPVICNGIDTFCQCDSQACSSLAQCPYPHCFNSPSVQGPGPCGASFHVLPTGSFASCVSEYGAYDVNGNVWELADSDDGLEHFRGGAYNCADSEALHRCDHDGTWGPSARGFRCCKDGAP